MIYTENKNFRKEVMKILMGKRHMAWKATVKYTIDNANKTGTLSVRVDEDLCQRHTEVATSIRLDYPINDQSYTSKERSVYKICFEVYLTDVLFDIITKPHFVECWKNAYDNTVKIIEDGLEKDCEYYISSIYFYNEKRNKSTQIKEICFSGHNIIHSKEMTPEELF